MNTQSNSPSLQQPIWRAQIEPPCLIISTSWSHDGLFLSASSFEKTFIWSFFSTEPIVEIPITEVVWSHNSLTLFGVQNNIICTWDMFTQTLTYTDIFHEDIASFACSPTKHYIAVGGGTFQSSVDVWDTQSGLQLDTYKAEIISPPHRMHRPSLGMVHDLAWSPDEKYIVSASGGVAVTVWSLEEKRIVATYANHPDEATAVSWSPDVQSIAVCTDNLIYLWNTTTHHLRYTYTGHTDEVQQVAWSPDSCAIASVGDDKIVHVWDSSSGNLLWSSPEQPHKLSSVAWSPDGKHIAVGDFGGRVTVWMIMLSPF